jgi:hypothetical protein
MAGAKLRGFGVIGLSNQIIRQTKGSYRSRQLLQPTW